jgi:hypothetical protein
MNPTYKRGKKTGERMKGPEKMRPGKEKKGENTGDNYEAKRGTTERRAV